MTTIGKTCAYKGRTYRLLWVGDTKFGRRAKLGFTDGSTEFWVDAKLISESSGPAASSSRPASRSGCPCCGRAKKLVRDREDGLMKCYDCCDMPPGGY